jgi:ABC-type multidrug transport system fused ATPase/permease subunit
VDEQQSFFVQLKEYFELQKRSIAVTTAEGLSRLLSAVIVAFVLILLGSMVLLLLSFAVAHCLGELTGSPSLGFLILFAVLLLLFIVVWAKRGAWIKRPVSAITDDVFGVAGLDKAQVHEEAAKSQQQLNESFSAAIAPLPKAKNRIEQFSQLVSKGTMIFEGVMFGLKLVRGFRSAFRKH